MIFKNLSIGDEFDFVEPGSIWTSFYDKCTKVSPRKYRSYTGRTYKVGSISCKVYHVNFWVNNPNNEWGGYNRVFKLLLMVW